MKKTVYKKYRHFLIITIGIILAFLIYQKFSHISAEETATMVEEICSDENRINDTNIISCYAKEFEKIAYQNGQGYAFGTLHVLQGIDPDSKNCHFIAHGIGWGIYKRNSSDRPNLMAASNSECSYGTQMGIIELYAASLPEKKFTKDIVSDICGDKPRGNCNHAVGHVALAETGNDMGRALELCSVLRDKQQRMSCFSGAFMEYIMPFNLADHGLVPESWKSPIVRADRLDDMEQLCRSYDDERAASCWDQISFSTFFKFNQDPKSMFDFCNRSPLQEGVKRCKYRAVDILVLDRNFETDYVKRICTIEHDSNFERNCYLVFIRSSLYTIKPQEASNIVNFCSSLDKKFSSACFEQIGSVLREKQVAEDEIKKLCQTAPIEFGNLCIGR